MDACAVGVGATPSLRFVEREQAVPHHKWLVMSMRIVLADDKAAALAHGRVVREDAVHGLADCISAPRMSHAAATFLRRIAGEHAVRHGTETSYGLFVEKDTTSTDIAVARHRIRGGIRIERATVEIRLRARFKHDAAARRRAV